MLTLYGALLAAIGEDVRLPGPVWALCIVWICAQAAGFLAAKVLTMAKFPPILLSETLFKHRLHDFAAISAG